MNFFGKYRKSKNDKSKTFLTFNIFKNSYTNFQIEKELQINDNFYFIDGFISNLDDFSYLWEQLNLTNEQKLEIISNEVSNFENLLNGSFTIIIFNIEEKELKIIRDRRGTRSIYFSDDKENRYFYFSSSLAILTKRIENLTLNKNRLIEYLNWNYASNASTFFHEIERIKPSTTLIFKKDKFIFKKNNNNSTKNNSKNNFDLNKFSYFLKKAIKPAINKDTKVGIMLSGGLDSSAIAISLKNLQHEGAKIYSANFTHLNSGIRSKSDESSFQENISKYTNYEHKKNEMKDISPLTSIVKNFNIFSEPVILPNMYLFEEILKSMMIDDVNLVLDGNDGDNVISHGYEVLYEYLRQLKLFSFIKEVYLYSKVQNINPIKGVLIFIKAFYKKHAYKKKFPISSYLKEKYKHVPDYMNYGIFASHEEKISQKIHTLGSENRNTFYRYFDIDNYSPFYDDNLIDFCLNMPSNFKFKNGYTRYILRKYLSKFLPYDHSFRPDKANLANGLLENFSIIDIKIIENELKNVNGILDDLIEINKIKLFVTTWKKNQSLTENQLINIILFINANMFLNKYRF